MVETRLIERDFPTIKASAPDLVRKALSRPIGAMPLDHFVPEDGEVLVIVPDRTRACGIADWGEALLNALNEAGADDGRIGCLIANGTHRGHSNEEKLDLYGEPFCRRAKPEDHNAEDAANLRACGRTVRGTEVFANRRACDAALVVTTGPVLPHYYAGFGGGRKALFPGVAGADSILQNHGLNLGGDGMPPDNVAPGILRSNPLHEDMLEAARMIAGNVFNLSLVCDSSHRPVAAFAGELEASHHAACDELECWSAEPVEPLCDIVVASCGGWPKDISMYQAHKSYDNAYRFCKPDGGLILVAECEDGLGAKGLEDWLQLGTAEAILDRLRGKFSIVGHNVWRIRLKSESRPTALVSSLPDEVVRSLGMIPAADADEAWSAVAARLEREPESAAVLPEANGIIPTMRNDAA